MLFSALAYIEPAKLRLFFHICNFFFHFHSLFRFSALTPPLFLPLFLPFFFLLFLSLFLFLLCSPALLLFLPLFLPCHYRITTVSATLLVPSQYPRSTLVAPLGFLAAPLFAFFLSMSIFPLFLFTAGQSRLTEPSSNHI